MTQAHRGGTLLVQVDSEPEGCGIGSPAQFKVEVATAAPPPPPPSPPLSPPEEAEPLVEAAVAASVTVATTAATATAATAAAAVSASIGAIKAAEAAALVAGAIAAAAAAAAAAKAARGAARAAVLRKELRKRKEGNAKLEQTISRLREQVAAASASTPISQESRSAAWIDSTATAVCEASSAVMDSPLAAVEAWSLDEMLEAPEVSISALLAKALRSPLQEAAKASGAVVVGGRRSVCVAEAPEGLLEKAFAEQLGEDAQCEERLAALLGTREFSETLAHALAPALRALHESSPAALSRASVARVESAPPLSGKFIATAEEAQPTLRARLDVAGELGSLSLTSLKERLCALLELEPALVNVTAGEGEAEGTSDGEGEGDGPSAELCIEMTCVSPDTLLLSASATRLHALPPGPSSELGVTLVRSAEASVDLVVPALRFGEVSALFGGLAAIIGKRPEVPLLQAMKQEHHGAADSREPFTTGNYSISTTSAIEHTFVVAPQEGPRLMESARPFLLGEAAPSGAGPDEQDSWWPHEPALRDDPTRRSHCRVPRPMEEFAEARAEVDTHLAAVGVPPIRDDEFIALRLYTGPMFEKYCAVLRGVPPGSAFLTGKFQKLCLGNAYPATIYALGDAISKLSKISRAEKVYRGVAGLRLPDEFLTRDEFGVRGGVEFGFLSATTDRSVALAYAASGSSTGVVYEIQQTMGSRGADISWCSQYPFEKEVCFAPLLGLEVQEGAGGAPAKRIEGGVVVVELLASVSHGSPEEAPPPELQPLPDSAPSGHLSSRKSKGASIAPTASVSAAEDDDDGQADGANLDDGPRLSTHAHTQSL